MGTKANRALRYAAGFLFFAFLFLSLMLSAYAKVRDEAMAQLYAQERILAEQAAAGIEEYFRYFERGLRFLVSDRGVQEASPGGKALLKGFYSSQLDNVAAITLMDASGRIEYSYPDESAAGRDISGQSHVESLLKTRMPTLSGVFRAVQGFDAVALHIPLFREGRFRGSVALLIPFRSISRRYLERIRLGSSGYALLFDNAGNELYGPDLRMVGRPVEEAAADYPDLAAMARTIRAAGPEGSGAAVYRYPAHGFSGGEAVAKRAYYKSVAIGDGFWSVVVTAPEADALASIDGFRDRWLFLSLLLIAAFTAWGLLFLRALLAAGRMEEVRRLNAELERAVEERSAELRKAQGQLVISEKLSLLGRLSASLAHRINSPLGAIASAGGSIAESLERGLAGELGRYAGLEPALRADYGRLLEEAARRRLSGPLRPSPGRAGRREAVERLKEAGVEEAEAVVDDLADMDLLDALPEAARLARAGGPAILDDLARLVGFATSSRIILEAAGRASAVVKAMGSYLKEGRFEEPRAVDLAAELDLVLSLYGPEALRGVQVVRRYEPGLRCLAGGESLTRVWSNLIDNALQAMGYAGRLELETRLEEGRALVLVADDGPGIAEADKGRVFEPFFTTKGPGEGTGLGLVIAKRIVEAEGGRIGFESAPGRTVFAVSLPLAAD